MCAYVQVNYRTNGNKSKHENKDKKIKIIFLDVDGELTYSNYRNSETENIDPEKVSLVKEICDRTGAKVVISSSWRMCDGIYNFLVKLLTDNGIDVVGKTDYIPTEAIDDISALITLTMLEELEYNIKHGTGRAAEIQKWIEENNVENFVILDDEDWVWSEYGYDKHWIQPTWFGDGGLKREHVEKAVEILGEA